MTLSETWLSDTAGVDHAIVFETDQMHLERLAALGPGECASARDLADYMDELLYCDIQTSLLVHVLPSCLRSWHEYLRNETFECPGFAELFYTVLEEKDTFAGILTDDQRQAVWEFMIGSILEVIDAQDPLRFEGTLLLHSLDSSFDEPRGYCVRYQYG